MIPVIVDSFPINGQDNVALNEIIRIVFNDIIAPINFEDIEVRNLNKNEIVHFEYTQDKDTITIVVNDRNSVGDNMFCGLTKYQITVRNVIIVSSPADRSDCVLSFTTKVETLEDFKEDELVNSPAIRFKCIATTPNNETKNIAPKYIKFVYNRKINPYSVFEKDEDENLTTTPKAKNLYVFKNSPEYIEEILLLRELEYQEDGALEEIQFDVKLLDNEIYIIPISVSEDGSIKTVLELESNSQYTVMARNITSVEALVADTEIVTFHTAPSPLYIEPEEITNSSYFHSVTSGNKSVNDIYDMVNRFSLDADNVAEEAGTKEAIDDDVANNNGEMIACVKNYVRYKTLYTLVYDRYITVVSASEEKKLSDLEISYANKPNYLKSLLDDLWNKMHAAEEEIKRYGETVDGIGLFIKGSNVDATYDFMDRTFKDFEGNRYWNYEE